MMNEKQKQQVAQALEEAKETGSFNLRAICQSLGVRPIDVINYWKELGCTAIPVEETGATVEMSQNLESVTEEQAKYACVLRIISALNGQSVYTALNTLELVADHIKLWHRVDVGSEYFQSRASKLAKEIGLEIQIVRGAEE